MDERRETIGVCVLESPAAPGQAPWALTAGAYAGFDDAPAAFGAGGRIDWSDLFAYLLESHRDPILLDVEFERVADGWRYAALEPEPLRRMAGAVNALVADEAALAATAREAFEDLKLRRMGGGVTRWERAVAETQHLIALPGGEKALLLGRLPAIARFMRREGCPDWRRGVGAVLRWIVASVDPSVWARDVARLPRLSEFLAQAGEGPARAARDYAARLDSVADPDCFVLVTRDPDLLQRASTYIKTYFGRPDLLRMGLNLAKSAGELQRV